MIDRSHANLIPMLKTAGNYKLIKEMAGRCFGQIHDVHFMVGSDPELQKQLKREENALEVVKSNPKVKFIMEHLNGSIINCKLLKGQDKG